VRIADMFESDEDMEDPLVEPDNLSDSEYHSAQSARDNDEVEMIDIDLLNGVDESAPVNRKTNARPAWSNMFGVVVHTLDELGKDTHDYEEFVNKNADDLELPSGASRVIKVVEEIDKGDDKLWYRAQFGGGEVMDVGLTLSYTIILKKANSRHTFRSHSNA
jgi:hypothetical protein